MQEKEIQAKINNLPDLLKEKVLNYIDSLLVEKERNNQVKPFNFKWEGKLIEAKKSVELQHESLKWR